MHLRDTGKLIPPSRYWVIGYILVLMSIALLIQCRIHYYRVDQNQLAKKALVMACGMGQTVASHGMTHGNGIC
jgi:hypothetical protein